LNLEFYLPYCFSLANDDLAMMYAQKKDWDRAIAEYKSLIVIGLSTRTGGWFTRVSLRLAQVYEKEGLTTEAVTEYERFLKLWEKRIEVGGKSLTRTAGWLL